MGHSTGTTGDRNLGRVDSLSHVMGHSVTYIFHYGSVGESI